MTTTLQNAPDAVELVDLLNAEFAGRYSFRLFGMGKEKTIIARKSMLVGLQLTVRGNEIMFQKTALWAAGSCCRCSQ